MQDERLGSEWGELVPGIETRVLLHRLLKTARKYGYDDHVTSDLVQETMLRLVRMTPEARVNIQHPTAWARSVLDHVHVDHLRERYRQSGLALQAAEEAERALRDADESEQPTALGIQELDELSGGLALLTPTERAVFDVLFDPWAGNFEALSRREAAQRLGMSEGAVKTALWAIRRKLRTYYKSCYPEMRTR